MFLDGLARRALWSAGMDYQHATGHGIGAYLNVHEYPPSIESSHDGYGLQKNMFTSNGEIFDKVQSTSIDGAGVFPPSLCIVTIHTTVLVTFRGYSSENSSISAILTYSGLARNPYKYLIFAIKKIATNKVT